MKLTIIAGSQRAQSQSLNVAHYLNSLAHHHFEQVEIIDLFQADLPLWNENFWRRKEDSQSHDETTATNEWQEWENIAKHLQQSDAVVLITPEWHGMATPALKNFLLLTSSEELGHKPVLLTSVSASINGVYPISELRMTGSKNNHANFLPDHLIFRNVDALLDESNQATDPEFHRRSQYTMTLLAHYASALAPIRQDMVALGQPFRYGM